MITAMQTRKSIALYGGSFNPIHLGHINLAIEMMEKGPLDEVWLCPAQLNPHKTHEKPLAAYHRLEMLKLAIMGIPGLAICMAELQRPAPSYTIDTLEALMPHCPADMELYLMMGEDAASTFTLWHRAEEIARKVPLLVGCRSLEQQPIDTTTKPPKSIQRALAKGRVATRLFDISSTEVRRRLAFGQYCGHLISEKVLAYIYGHRLYS
jgi:nicotinate-nucleotide adenylyltransferase